MQGMGSSLPGVLGAGLGVMAANPNSPLSQMLNKKSPTGNSQAPQAQNNIAQGVAGAMLNSPTPGSPPPSPMSSGQLGNLSQAASLAASQPSLAGALSGGAPTAAGAAGAAAPAAAGATSALAKASPYLAIAQMLDQAAQNQAPKWGGRGGFSA